MKDDDFTAGVILGCLIELITVLTILGFSKLLPSQMEKKFRLEAVAEGHAEWVVEPDGSVSFEWINCSND